MFFLFFSQFSRAHREVLLREMRIARENLNEINSIQAVKCKKWFIGFFLKNYKEDVIKVENFDDSSIFSIFSSKHYCPHFVRLSELLLSGYFWLDR
jgi:hypothetical protein